MSDDLKLVEAWRKRGPVKWAEGAGGWIGTNGKPVKLTDWQRAALSAWWDNRAECTTFAISNTKKTGKTFLDSLLLCWRWLALPGQHFAQGNDFEQSQARQILEVAEMVRRNPYLNENTRIGKSELTFIPTGSTLSALASDATGNSGANFLTTSHTETWGVIYEGSIRSYEELTPVPGLFYGFPCLRICDSYAGITGESITWQSLVDRGLNGERINDPWPIYKAGQLILFHATGAEARERCYRGTAEEAKAYYAEQQRTLRPNTFLRFHANQETTGESQFLPAGAWDACYSPEVKPLTPNDARRVILGADASTSRDYTALVGVERGSIFKDTVLVRTWKPQRGILRLGKPTIDLEATIGEEVLEMHKRGQVEAVIADPFQLHTLIIKWERAGIKVIELPQSSGRVEADQSLYDSVIARTVRHYNHPELNAALNDAIAIETPRGFRLAKDKTSKKIDAAVALSMALHGALGVKEPGKMQVLPENPFYDGAPISEYLEIDGQFVYAPGHNTRPHPQGVTWRNCRYSSKGCEACVKELEAEGYYQKQDEDARILLQRGAGEPATEQEADREFFSHLGMLNQDNQTRRQDEQFIQKFKRAALGRRN